MASLGSEMPGHWVTVPTVAATRVKNEFGAILDRAIVTAPSPSRATTPHGQYCYLTRSSSRLRRPARVTWTASAKNSMTYSKRCSAQRLKKP